MVIWCLMLWEAKIFFFWNTYLVFDVCHFGRRRHTYLAFGIPESGWDIYILNLIFCTDWTMQCNVVQCNGIHCIVLHCIALYPALKIFNINNLLNYFNLFNIPFVIINSLFKSLFCFPSIQGYNINYYFPHKLYGLWYCPNHRKV